MGASSFTKRTNTVKADSTIIASIQSSMATKVGPFGSGGGYNQDIDSDMPPASLKKIEIWSTNGSGGLINAISFTYITVGNDDTMSAIWGTDKGVHNKIVDSHPISHVYVTRLSGKFDSNGVKSLTVVTSDGTTYGPYGDATSGKDFDIPEVKSAIVAFFGRSGHVLHALGAYIVTKAC